MGTNDVLKAVSIGIDLIAVATRALEANARVDAIVAGAKAEGRTELTPAEWAVLLDLDNVARNRLAALVGA